MSIMAPHEQNVDEFVQVGLDSLRLISVRFNCDCQAQNIGIVRALCCQAFDLDRASMEQRNDAR